jgi:hypothetical protein
MSKYKTAGQLTMKDKVYRVSSQTGELQTLGIKSITEDSLSNIRISAMCGESGTFGRNASISGLKNKDPKRSDYPWSNMYTDKRLAIGAKAAYHQTKIKDARKKAKDALDEMDSHENALNKLVDAQAVIDLEEMQVPCRPC